MSVASQERPDDPRLADLRGIVDQHARLGAPIDRVRVSKAFRFASEHDPEHSDRQVEVAKICAAISLDTESVCAALFHRSVDDGRVSLEEIRDAFGDDVAQLVDGVTQLGALTFRSHDETQAKNFRDMVAAIATDVRVILVKLADCLEGLRTPRGVGEHGRRNKAKEALEVYAPLARRLGLDAMQSELDDIAFKTLRPRRYREIKALVDEQRAERARYVERAGEYLKNELDAVGIEAEISVRPKHFYSIHQKMTRKGRLFNEIYDLTAMRVVVDSVKDCYGAIGVIHSIWKPFRGRFKDWVAMPKFDGYQSLHTAVFGPEGRPLEIQVRTHEMHGVAGLMHWRYKEPLSEPDRRDGARQRLTWLRSLLDWQEELAHDTRLGQAPPASDGHQVLVRTPEGALKALPTGATPLDFANAVQTDVGHRYQRATVNGRTVPPDYKLQSGDTVEVITGTPGQPLPALANRGVFVLTPKDEVKALPARATPLDFAYAVHTEIGHRYQRATVNGRTVPPDYRLQSGDTVEVITAPPDCGPLCEWLDVVETSRARRAIKKWLATEARRRWPSDRVRQRARSVRGRPTAIHLTPKELARELGIHRHEVVDKCMRLGVPICGGRIDKTRFLTTLRKGERTRQQLPDT